MSAQSPSTSQPTHRVVIIGAGFGGLFAARALRKAPVDVTVIDRTNHHLFQPLLYQVATGILSEGEIAPPTRDVLRQAAQHRGAARRGHRRRPAAPHGDGRHARRDGRGRRTTA